MAADAGTDDGGSSTVPALDSGFMAAPPGPYRLPVTIALLGARGAGKTAVAARLLHDTFRRKYTPTFHEIHEPVPLSVDGVEYDLKIVDTDGQREESPFGAQYTLGVDGFLLMFAVDDVASFGIAKRVNSRLLSAMAVQSPDEVPRILVGNKIDVRLRAVSREDAMRMARYIRADYTETSAATGEMCEEVFREIVRKVRDSRLPPPDQEQEEQGGEGSGCTVM